MDLLTIYYYAGIPALTCTLLSNSLTALSSSISSSQNIVRFISEHKNCDSIVFKSELETLDLDNKLKIIESLVFNVIKKYCNSNEEFEEIRHNINNHDILTWDKQDESKQFEMIEIKHTSKMFERIDEPVRYALLSTSETVQNINEIIVKIHEKILKHQKSYLNKIVTLCLKVELHDFKKKIQLLDSRVQLLLDLLKIYLPVSHR
jgi:hypothetical protein